MLPVKQLRAQSLFKVILQPKKVHNISQKMIILVKQQQMMLLLPNSKKKKTPTKKRKKHPNSSQRLRKMVMLLQYYSKQCQKTQQLLTSKHQKRMSCKTWRGSFKESEWLPSRSSRRIWKKSKEPKSWQLMINWSSKKHRKTIPKTLALKLLSLSMPSLKVT